MYPIIPTQAIPERMRKACVMFTNIGVGGTRLPASRRTCTASKGVPPPFCEEDWAFAPVAGVAESECVLMTIDTTPGV